jgi:hypothetical protein
VWRFASFQMQWREYEESRAFQTPSISPKAAPDGLAYQYTGCGNSQLLDSVFVIR